LSEAISIVEKYDLRCKIHRFFKQGAVHDLYLSLCFNKINAFRPKGRKATISKLVKFLGQIKKLIFENIHSE